MSVAAGSLEYFSAARIEVRFARAQGREVDGDTLSEGTRLTVDTEPGALRMRLPRAPGGTSNTARTSPTSRTAPAAPAARTVQL